MSSVNYYVINLPWAQERREYMTEQARAAGLNFRFVEATAGRNLTNEERSHYDDAYRRRIMPRSMTDNEIACMTSHRRALREFLDSGADYGVILEDDALLTPNFTAAICELTEHLRGWEIAKLYTGEGKLYPLMGRQDNETSRAVFPKKILWMTLGYMYTREGAKEIYMATEQYWRPADAQIGEVILNNHIPTIGISPGAVERSSHCEISNIDEDGGLRKTAPRRTFFQYLRYRLHVLQIACGKLRMRRMMRSHLHRV